MYNKDQESYYDHRCLIVPQKDVLQIDIVGGGFIIGFKRWWNDLFLLSYSDRRAWLYFTSSRNMHLERFKQYRQYRNRIHPFSKFRNIWDCLMVHVFILHTIAFHHNTSVLFGKVFHMFFYYVALCVELIVIADLVVNLETGIIDSQTKRIILDTKQGILNYCCTKLFLHCGSAIPLQWIMLLRYGGDIECTLCKTNYFVCALRIINVISLYRVFESSKYWTRARAPSKAMYFFRFLRIGVVGFTSILQLFDLSDTICLITNMWTGKVNETALFNYLLAIKFLVAGAPRNINLFCFNFGRICKSLLLFSFGGPRLSTYYLDKMTSLVAYIIANIFYMWCLLECYGLIIRRKYSKDQMMINKTLALNLASYRQLPNAMHHKINQFYDFKMSDIRRVEVSNELYAGLPSVLKREATLHCYSKRIARLPFFSGWPPELMQQIVLALTQNIFLTGDIVAEPWMSGDGLMIVDVGELAVYSAQEHETGHLIDGDYFGELSLVTDKEVRMSYVIAITSCKVLILKKTVFRILMRDHADLFSRLRLQLMQKNRIPEHQTV
ncbi:potassium/sodium hyperpolarization-activated cyclic nucleotide-gated channel 1-like [Manduca sexta]|uniref:potassium/sodium hyperpolarization-activated cyclic nucleotide-gated channel 1-like n=1 Tax=Manduca sexta TaxID=7130 RepID=UPI00188E3851|nr:potassium/sodium hyperpolarization-activated cyclic nucleotide-gated channel 1-like [Manduca sexta]